uniref:Uncharacterized protein n=1 Tax=Timema genevievae TaxID=629358 RepID=A0A7R9JQ57_TIMGE|nr:unnamed protein product [Timema genevievae]
MHRQQQQQQLQQQQQTVQQQQQTTQEQRVSSFEQHVTRQFTSQQKVVCAAGAISRLREAPGIEMSIRSAHNARSWDAGARSQFVEAPDMGDEYQERT